MMKIDEGCIDHNVTRLVTELTENIYDGMPDDKVYTLVFAYMTLAEIRGVVEMAEVLKEVLKA